MSDFDVIFRVSNGLRSKILTALADAPSLNFPQNDGIERISLSPPSQAHPADIIASLYLYRVDMIPRPRPEGPLNDRLGGPSAASLQLRYLFTPCGFEQDNQIMLGRALQFIISSPVLTITDGPRGSSEPDTSQCRLTTETLSFEHLTQLWNAFRTPFRTSLQILADGMTLGDRMT